jgi:hypothetical protein
LYLRKKGEEERIFNHKDEKGKEERIFNHEGEKGEEGKEGLANFKICAKGSLK